MGWYWLSKKLVRAGCPVTESAVQATKASLMGPLSGLGDTLIQGALAPVLLSVGISLARDGSVLGPMSLYRVHRHASSGR